MDVPIDIIRSNVARALEEDLGTGDLHRELLEESGSVTGSIICRSGGILYGQEWVNETYRQEPELAFEAALKQPTHALNGGMEANVIAEIAVFDPSRAVGMLSRIRDDALTDLNSRIYVAQELVRTHFDFDKVTEIGRMMQPGPRQDYYYYTVMPYWASYQPVGLLNRIHHLPKAHRSYAAASLIRADSLAHVLNAQQIADAERYLTKDELTAVESSLPGQ